MEHSFFSWNVLNQTAGCKASGFEYFRYWCLIHTQETMCDVEHSMRQNNFRNEKFVHFTEFRSIFLYNNQVCTRIDFATISKSHANVNNCIKLWNCLLCFVLWCATRFIYSLFWWSYYIKWIIFRFDIFVEQCLINSNERASVQTNEHTA